LAVIDVSGLWGAIINVSGLGSAVINVSGGWGAVIDVSGGWVIDVSHGGKRLACFNVGAWDVFHVAHASVLPFAQQPTLLVDWSAPSLNEGVWDGGGRGHQINVSSWSAVIGLY